MSAPRTTPDTAPTTATTSRHDRHDRRHARTATARTAATAAPTARPTRPPRRPPGCPGRRARGGVGVRASGRRADGQAAIRRARELDAHRRARDELRRQVAALGAEPVEAAVAYVEPFPVTGRAGGRRLMAHVNIALGATYADVAAATDPAAPTRGDPGGLRLGRPSREWGAEPEAFPGAVSLGPDPGTQRALRCDVSASELQRRSVSRDATATQARMSGACSTVVPHSPCGTYGSLDRPAPSRARATSREIARKYFLRYPPRSMSSAKTRSSGTPEATTGMSRS